MNWAGADKFPAHHSLHGKKLFQYLGLVLTFTRKHKLRKSRRKAKADEIHRPADIP